MPKLTHLNASGEAHMVDVSAKEATQRVAVAEALVRLSREAFAALENGTLAKGDALAVARIAGIMGAKKTSDLIPLCHPLPLSSITIAIALDPAESTVRIEATAVVVARTGVEMEALTGASVAALAIYDMCKAIDKGITIERVRLLHKEGGASGPYTAST